MSNIQEQINRLFQIIGNSKLNSELTQAPNGIDSNDFYFAINKNLDDALKVSTAIVRGHLGTYNASINTPTLIDGTGIEGDSYLVTVGGTQNFGNGNKTMGIDDVIAYRQGQWRLTTLGNNILMPLTTKGDLFTYSTSEQRLPVGTDGYMLIADSAEPTGLRWAITPTVAGLQEVTDIGNITTNAIRVSKLEIDTANTYLDTAAGVLQIWNSNDIQIKNYTNNVELYLSNLYGIGFRHGGFYWYYKDDNLTESRTYQMPDASGILTLSVNGYVANANGEITIPGASFPLTTKGDIFTFSTLEDRLPVGTNGQVLSADSAENTGLKWITLGAGSGDMILASVQTNTGTKTFLDTTFKLRNVANTFDGYFVNTNTADRVYTLQNASGTLAFLSDITGTNSGTNTGDQSLTNSSNATSHTVTLSGGTSFQLVEGTNITLTTTGTGANGILTINATGGGGGDDVSTFAEKVGNLVGSDRLVGLSGATDFSETISGIPLSIFNNDSGWTSNVGDMVLASVQINSGAKTFLDTTFKLRNVANTFNGSFVNTNTADRIYTLQNANGILAFLSDITGANSGTNTGDQTLANSSNATSHTLNLSALGGSIQLIEGVNITLTTGGTGLNGTVTISCNTEVKISTYWVDKNGNTDFANFEVGDLFRGSPSVGREVAGRVIALPFNVDDNTKCKLTRDNYESI